MGHWSELHKDHSNEVWVEDGRNDDPICPHCGNSDVARMAQRVGQTSLTMTFCKECCRSFDAALRKCPKCGAMTFSESVHHGFFYCTSCLVLIYQETGWEYVAETGQTDGDRCPVCKSDAVVGAVFGRGWRYCNHCTRWFDPETGRNTQNTRWIEAYFGDTWSHLCETATIEFLIHEEAESEEAEEAEVTDWREVWAQAWK